MSARPHVAISGGGFGGLCVAQARKRAGVDVTLIDRNSFHPFQPLHYEIATESLSPGEIAAPLRSVLSRQRIARMLLGVRAKEIDLDGVTIAQGCTESRLDARTVIWAGRAASSPLGRAPAKSAGAVRDNSGRIKVEPDLTLPRFRNIFVIGDLAISLDRSGEPLPGLAQVAMQGGAYAAKSITSRIKSGHQMTPFDYFGNGTLAVIGCAAAVANAFEVKLSELPGVAYSGLHPPDVHSPV